MFYHSKYLMNSLTSIYPSSSLSKALKISSTSSLSRFLILIFENTSANSDLLIFPFESLSKVAKSYYGVYLFFTALDILLNT